MFLILSQNSLLNELSTCEELAASGQQLASGVSQALTLGNVLFNVFINGVNVKSECSVKFINDTYLRVV